MNLAEPTGKSEWQTPSWVLDGVRESLGIDQFSYDPATSLENPTGAALYSTRETNGLSTDWNDPIFGRYLWLNPPWGKGSPILPWVQKFSAYKGIGFLLCPSNTGSKWFHLLLDRANSLFFFRGRVNYVDPATGSEVKGCPFDSCLVVRNHRPALDRFLPGGYAS